MQMQVIIILILKKPREKTRANGLNLMIPMLQNLIRIRLKLNALEEIQKLLRKVISFMTWWALKAETHICFFIKGKPLQKVNIPNSLNTSLIKCSKKWFGRKIYHISRINLSTIMNTFCFWRSLLSLMIFLFRWTLLHKYHTQKR